MNLTYIQVFKSHTNKLYILRHCTYIVNLYDLYIKGQDHNDLTFTLNTPSCHIKLHTTYNACGPKAQKVVHGQDFVYRQ
jgi:hypothetical protein